MNIVQSIHLQKVGAFKNVEFKIPKGISVIYGLNLQSSKNSKNSNAVGKSFLFAEPAEMIYEDPIVGEKSDILKMGARTFKFINYKGRKVELTRRTVGKSDKLELLVNGKQKYRTIPKSKAALKSLWPITPDEYRTYVHLDSRTPHPLVMGSSSERTKFFTSFFGLDKIDAERKLFQAELLKLSRTKAAFVELKTQYKIAKQDLLDSDSVKQFKEKHKKYKTKIQKLQDKMEHLQDIKRLVSFAASSKQQIQTLITACGSEDQVTEEVVTQLLNDTKWELKKYNGELEEAELWEQYKKDIEHYNSAFDKLSENTRSLLEEKGARRLKELTDFKVDKLDSVKAKLKSLESDVEDLQDLIGKGSPKKVPKVDRDLSELETLKRAYSHQLKHSLKFQEGKCETCGQIVKIKNPKVIEKKLNEIEELIDALDKYQAYKEQKKRYEDAQTKLAELKSERKGLIGKVKKLEHWVTIRRELVNLPDKPKKFKGKKLQTKVLRKMISEVEAKLSLLQFMEPHIESITKFLSLSKKDIRSVAQVDTLSQNINELNSKISRVRAKLDLHKTMKSRAKDMKSRLLEMKASLKDEEALKHLVNGYKDMKKMAMESISHRLMQLVNKYAMSILPEDYKFSIEWGTKVSLMVHRRYKKYNLQSDVRKLSGAESTLFTLILVCALLAFVPSKKRCSMLILDELSVRLSHEMTEVFHKMLKILNALIPSIIVITPKSDEYYPDTHPFTIIKKDGVATLVPGFPNKQDVK